MINDHSLWEMLQGFVDMLGKMHLLFGVIFVFWLLGITPTKIPAHSHGNFNYMHIHGIYP